MNSRQAAELLGISENQVRYLIKVGHLRAEKYGRNYWILPEAVEEARQRKGQWKNRKEGNGNSGS